jgi:endonuclease/exonuclease/phosphatase family metal-dependent hydrolase
MSTSTIVVAGMPAAGHINPTLPVVRELVRRGHALRMQLDWILASSELRFTRHHTLPDRVSDHLAVRAELEWLS